MLRKCSENSRSQIVFRTDIFRKLTLGASDLNLIDSSVLFQRAAPLKQQIKFAVNRHHLASSSSSLVDYHHKIEETFLEIKS